MFDVARVLCMVYIVPLCISMAIYTMLYHVSLPVLLDGGTSVGSVYDVD